MEKRSGDGDVDEDDDQVSTNLTLPISKVFYKKLSTVLGQKKKFNSLVTILC